MNNGKKNILVVDDNADISGLIKQGLEYLYPTEYHVICVNCGKKCFEALKKMIKFQILFCWISKCQI